MPKHDIETYCRELGVALADDTTGINSFITAINTEKGDDPVMSTIDDGALIFQTMTEAIVNFDPFLIYYIDSVSSESAGPHTLRTYKVNIEIVFASCVNEKLLGYLLLRYQRALRDFAEYHWRRLDCGVQSSLSDLNPVEYSLSESDETHKSIGISISVTYGG